jgi:hypothetical protein
MRAILLFMILGLVFMTGAYAASSQVNAIQITNCGFTAVPLVCGQSAIYDCNVNDLNAGGPVIANVNYYITHDVSIGEQTYAATALSANRTFSIWELHIPVTQSTAMGNITAIDVLDSLGNYCAYDMVNGVLVPRTATGCASNYTAAQQSYVTDCTCSFSQVRSCNPNGTLTVQNIASPSCSIAGQSSFNTYGTCDYCKEVLGADTKWIPTYSACTVNASGLGPDGLLPSQISGIAVKDYVAAPGDVCFASGAAGSQIKPADAGISVICKEDYWNTAGKTSSGTSQDREIHITNAPFIDENIPITPSLGVDGIALHPLVADWGYQGSTGILIPTTSGFKVYDSTLTSVRNSVTTGFADWEGELGAIGVNDFDHSGNTIGYAAANVTGAAGIAFNSTSNTDVFVAYWDIGGSFVRQCTTDLGVVPAGGAGVACDGVTCFYLDNNMVLHAYDTSVCADVHTDNLATVATSGYAANVPILLSLKDPSSPTSSDFINTVAVLGMDASFHPTVYACNVVLGACTNASLGFTTSATLQNFSRLVAENPVVSGQQAKIHFTSVEPGSATVDVWGVPLVATSFVDGTPTVLSFGQINDQIMSGAAGGNSTCISNPVAATCPGGIPGVAVASLWNSGSVTASSKLLDTGRGHLDLQGSTASPYSQVDFTGGACSGGVCVGVFHNGNLQDIQRNDGSGWIDIGVPVMQTAAPGNNSILGIGMENSGVIDVVIGDYDGFNFFATGIFNEYNNLRVWKYDGSWRQVSSGVLSSDKMISIELSGLNNINQVKTMQCSDTSGCSLFGSNANGSSSVNVPFVININGESVSNFIPSNAVFVGNNVNSSFITGYAVMGNDKYISVENANGYAVIKYIGGITPQILDSSNGAGKLNGLYANAGILHWVNIGDDQAVMTSNGTGATGNGDQFVLLSTSDQLIYGNDSAVKSFPLQTANITIKHYDGSSVGVDAVKTILFTRPALSGIGDSSYSAGMAQNGEYWTVASIMAGIQHDGDAVLKLFISASHVYSPVLGILGGGVADSKTNQVTLCSQNLTLSGTCVPITPSFSYVNRFTGVTEVIQDYYPYDMSSGFIQAMYRIDGSPTSYFAKNTGGSSNSFSGSYVDLSCWGIGASFFRVSDATVNTNICPNRISAMDVDNDGVDEIAMPSGIYDVTDGSQIHALSGNVNAAVEAVDVSSDTYGDFISLTNTNLEVLLSKQTNVAYGAVLSALNVSCSALGDGTIVAAVTEAKSPDPLKTVFSGTLSAGLNGGLVVTKTTSSDGVFSFGKQNAGAYVVAATMTDTVTGQSFNGVGSCSITSVGPPNGNNGFNQANTSCAIGQDGVFNFNDALVNHHWLLGVNSQEPVKNGQYIQVDARNNAYRMDYSLACPNQQFTVDVNESYNAASSWKLQVIDANSNVLGAVSVHDGYVYLVSGVGGNEIKIAAVDTSVDDLRLSLDLVSNTEAFSINGNVMITNQQLMTNNPGSIVLIRYISASGLQSVYSITTGAAGSQISTPSGDVFLSRCVDVSQRDFGVQPAGGLSKNANGSYYVPTNDVIVSRLAPNVDAYCVNKGGAIPCSYADLQEVISRNSVCYSEAYSYCVYKTFGSIDPTTNKYNLTSLQSSTKGLSGAVVCSAALGGKVATSGLIVPVFSVIWSLFTSTLIGGLTLIILVLILVIGLAVYARRR